MHNYLPSPHLRERAETLLRQSPRDIRMLSYADLQALVHELQIHEIELEMQSEELCKTQQDLQESCDRFADLYDLAPVGYLTLDAHKKIVEANLTVAIMLGMDRADLPGRKLSDFIAREEQDKFYLHCQALFAGAYPEHHASPANHYYHKQICELAMRKSCGTRLWCRLDSVVFQTLGRKKENGHAGEIPAAGSPDMLCRMAVIDITECKLAEQARQDTETKLKVLADTVPDILYLCDAQGRREYVNPQFYLFTGMLPGSGEGYGWQEAVHPDDLELLLSSRLYAVQRGEAWEGKFRLRSTAGDYHWFIGRARPLLQTNGTVHKWLGSETDIDQLIRSEQALKEIDQRKNEFLAMLAHELRNPLAPIRTAVQLLHDRNLDKSRFTWVRDILERNVAHMIRLVDDLLDTAHITSGTITLCKLRLDLAAIIERAVDTARPLIETKKQQLHVTFSAQPVYLEGDFVRLTQVFSNLLNNSAKYTAAGGCIDLQAGSEGAHAIVRIRDNGMGITANLLSHVFDMFRQDERGLDRAQGGLGVGLTLVKKLVELHGGEVTAHSAGSNQGAEFVVRLPRLADTEAEAEHAAPYVDNNEPRTAHRILLVEDNPDVADSLALLLELFGHSVEIAPDGLQGLAAAQKFQPDVIVLDIGIPGINGYELAERLRAENGFQDTLIVALSGYRQSIEDEKRAAASGIDHYLIKPADPERLRNLLDQHRSGKRRQTHPAS